MPSRVLQLFIPIGSNEVSKQVLEILWFDFKLQISTLKDTGEHISLSGPIPSLRDDHSNSSSLLSQHNGLKGECNTARQNLNFIDNFNLLHPRCVACY